MFHLKSNHKLLRCSLILLIFSILFKSSIAQVAGSRDKLSVIGYIAAYDSNPYQLVSAAPSSQFLIIRISARVRGHEKSQYLKAVYNYWSEKDMLPDEFFDSNKTFQFTLLRDRACDRLFNEEKRSQHKADSDYRLIEKQISRSLGSEKEIFPEYSTLPCYRMVRNGIKASKR